MESREHRLYEILMDLVSALRGLQVDDERARRVIEEECNIAAGAAGEVMSDDKRGDWYEV